jgi:hypothetical protein
MVVQPAILTYPTMVFYFSLAPQVLWNDLLPGISVRVLASHFGFVIATSGPQGGLIHMYDISKPFSKPLLDNDSRRSFRFTLFTPIKGRIDSLTVYIYKAETCTYILRYNTCISSYPRDRK